MHHGESFSFVPANRSLTAVEIGLVNAFDRKTVLKQYLDDVKNGYDYGLLDCRPSLGMLGINALSAADCVLIPVQLPCPGHKAGGRSAGPAACCFPMYACYSSKICRYFGRSLVGTQWIHCLVSWNTRAR